MVVVVELIVVKRQSELLPAEVWVKLKNSLEAMLMVALMHYTIGLLTFRGSDRLPHTILEVQVSIDVLLVVGTAECSLTFVEG
jgi:hypothetical protein